MSTETVNLQPVEPGQREWMNLDPADYHALPAYGSSALRCFVLDGTLEFWARYVAKIKPIPDTDAMRMGRAFHAAMEGDPEWESRYRIVPDTVQDDELVDEINGEITGKATPLNPGDELNFKLPTHREYRDRHRALALADGVDYLTPDERETVHRQVQAVYDNPECQDILSHNTNVLSEVACVYNHGGVLRKALLDRRINTGILDYKKTYVRNVPDIMRECSKRAYDRQLGDQLFVTGLSYACLITVTDSAPFEANVWEMPQLLMQRRKEEAERATEAIGQLLRQSLLDDCDSQGVPLSYHNELWGSRIPFDYQELNVRMAQA